MDGRRTLDLQAHQFQDKEARQVQLLLLLRIVTQRDLAVRIKSVDVFSLDTRKGFHFNDAEAWDNIYVSLDSIKAAIEIVISRGARMPKVAVKHTENENESRKTTTHANASKHR